MQFMAFVFNIQLHTYGPERRMLQQQQQQQKEPKTSKYTKNNIFNIYIAA